MSDPFLGLKGEKVGHKLDEILEEVAAYSVDIQEDPTQPHLGTKYLQKVLAQCRNFTNRVTFYLQAAMRLDKGLKTEIRYAELNMDLNMRKLLADDTIVRQQASIDDRKAMAGTILKTEQEALDALRVRLVDVEETVKILKMKHAELLRTSQDIKLQRIIVKDDKETRLGGNDGYDVPQTKQDKSVPDGMPAPVTADTLSPEGLLPPSAIPDDMPAPVDAVHEQYIREFLSKPAGLRPLCSECAEPQLPSPLGMSCKNGHAGAEPLAPMQLVKPPPAPAEPEPALISSMSLDDLMS